MQAIKEYIKSNYRICIVSIAMAIFIILEWILAGTFDIGKTERQIVQYDNFDSLYITGYSVEDHLITREANDACIIAPTDGQRGMLGINAKCKDGKDIGIKVNFSDGENGFVDNKSKLVALDNEKIVKVKIPNGATSARIKFVGDYGKTIELDSIHLYKKDLCFNKRFIATAVLATIVLFFVLFILLKLLSSIMDYNNPFVFLCSIILVGESLFVFICFLTNSYYWGSYFAPSVSDSFMDYFHMLALLNNDDPYYLDASYPAMCFLLLKLLHTFLPVSAQEIAKGVLLRDEELAMFGFIVMIFICMAAIYLLFEKIFEEQNNKKALLVLLFSGPILYTVQRGNILIWAFVFLLVYYLYYDSEDKKLRYVAYFALAISASIKIYPALFGFMTLKKKRYKETVALGIIGFLVFIMPFFAFDGVETIKGFLHGLTAASDLMTNHGAGENISLYNIGKIVGVFCKTEISISQVVLAIATVLLLIFALLTEVEWEAWFLLATACAWFPTFSFTYVLVLYYPAVFTAVKSNKLPKKDIFLLGTLLMPLSTPYMSWVDRYLGTKKVVLPMSFTTIIFNIIIVYFVLRIVLTIVSRYVFREKYDGLLKWINGFSVAFVCVILLIGFYAYNFKAYSQKYSFEGKGTKNSPYIIKNTDDLLYLQKVTNEGEDFAGAYFVQTANIELDGVTSFTPIGWSEEDASFSGIYDGMGHSIINYYSLSDHDEDMGLFGTLNGEVYNLNMINCNIGGESVGGIAYEVSANGKIANCYVNGLLYGYQVGGIAAVNKGTIENCVVFVNANATIVNGIAESEEAGAKILNSYSNENVRYNTLNGTALSMINSYVERNNSVMHSEHNFNNWIVDENYFVTLSE